MGRVASGRAYGITGCAVPRMPSQIRFNIGPAAVAPVPACSTMPTIRKRALVCPCRFEVGPQLTSQDVSCLPKTSAVPVLPPIRFWYFEPM